VLNKSVKRNGQPSNPASLSSVSKSRVIQHQKLSEAANTTVQRSFRSGDIWKFTLTFKEESTDAKEESKDKASKSAPGEFQGLFARPSKEKASSKDSGKSSGPRAMLSACHNGDELGVIVPDLDPLRPDDKWLPFVSFVNPEDYVSIVPTVPPHHSDRCVDRMMMARQLMESYEETDGVPLSLLELGYSVSIVSSLGAVSPHTRQNGSCRLECARLLFHQLPRVPFRISTGTEGFHCQVFECRTDWRSLQWMDNPAY